MDYSTKPQREGRWGQLTRTAWIILVSHAALLAWSGWLHSPTFNEVGHLPAGLSHLFTGRFELYRANPPLVRCVAALAVAPIRPKTDWRHFNINPSSNSVIPVAMDFVSANGRRSFWLYTLARWACIPFSLLGSWLCFRLATEMYGIHSGLLALTLWCFSPDIVGHGATIMPDVPAAALGLAACYAFRRWLIEPVWYRAFVSGLVLGLAELTKFTSLILYPVGVAMWVLFRASPHGRISGSSFARETAMLSLTFVVSIVTINLGYGFDRSFQRLGDFGFQSRSFKAAFGSRPSDLQDPGYSESSWVARVPIPLPQEYVQGIDKQKSDFEQGMRSYLAGRWKDGGWWYFYLYALAIKLPLGTWALFAMAVGATLLSRGYSRSWRHEILLVLPAVTILVLVSSQTGISLHPRYVYPALPFVFVWVSKVARAFKLNHQALIWATAGSLVWSVGSTLSIYPHTLSYFNELVGGPMKGSYHLLDSSIAWGQDLLLLKGWYNRHPEARPFHLVSFGWVDPRVAGIDFRLPPPGQSVPNCVPNAPPKQVGPLPGWYAIDVNYLHGSDLPVHDGEGGMYWPSPDGMNFEYFRRFSPVATAGYSIYIYHITPAQAYGMRMELGSGNTIPNSGFRGHHESAGINRHGVADARAAQGRSSEPP